MAALIGLGHQYLDDAELDIMVEGLMGTTLGQRLLERGREEGRQEGQREGLEQAILRVLTTHFGPVPSTVREQIARVEDLQRLEALLDRAIAAHSLEEFAQTLR